MRQFWRGIRSGFTAGSLLMFGSLVVLMAVPAIWAFYGCSGVGDLYREFYAVVRRAVRGDK